MSPDDLWRIGHMLDAIRAALVLSSDARTVWLRLNRSRGARICAASSVGIGTNTLESVSLSTRG